MPKDRTIWMLEDEAERIVRFRKMVALDSGLNLVIQNTAENFILLFQDLKLAQSVPYQQFARGQLVFLKSLSLVRVL